MQIGIVDKGARQWTDNPHELIGTERHELMTISRLDAIKRHREVTESTLAAAVRCVDDLRSR